MIVSPLEVEETPELLNEYGQLKLLSAGEYDQFTRNSVRLWCHKNARYGLPTLELMTWLRRALNGRKAIEIGAGHGDLSYHLGIPATDSYLQSRADIQALYEAMKQPTILYPERVKKLEAAEAIEEYDPEVIIGSWVTQWIAPDVKPTSNGSIHGIREDEIVASGRTYILIGNVVVHGDKKIMSLPHYEVRPPWLRSRATFPELDRIWIWNQ